MALVMTAMSRFTTNLFWTPKVSPVRSILCFKRGISWLCRMSQNTQLALRMECKWVLPVWRMNNYLLGIGHLWAIGGKKVEAYLFSSLFLLGEKICPYTQYHNLNWLTVTKSGWAFVNKHFFGQFEPTLGYIDMMILTTNQHDCFYSK